MNLEHIEDTYWTTAAYLPTYEDFEKTFLWVSPDRFSSMEIASLRAKVHNLQFDGDDPRKSFVVKVTTVKDVERVDGD